MKNRNNNLFSKLNRNRKGVLDIPLIELIYLIVAVVIILFLIYLAFSFYSFFKEGKEHESTVNNLKVLSENIRQMVKEDKKLVTRTTPYYISKGYVLVGFNNDNKDSYSECSKEIIKRPILCEDNACLCIYQLKEETILFDENPPPLECEVFDKNIIFLAPFNEDKRGSNPDNVHFRGGKYGPTPSFFPMTYGNLVLYGPGCEMILSTKHHFNVKTIYLEKYTEGNEHYVFIAKYKDDVSDAVYKRKNKLENKYVINKAS